MYEHYFAFHLVPLGHPGACRRAGPGEEVAADVFERAAAEADALRARLRQLQPNHLEDLSACPV